MLRKILFSLCLIASSVFSAAGQAKLVFSQDVSNSNDNNVKAIASLWQSYFEKRLAGRTEGIEFDRAEYWNQEDIDNGRADIIGIEVTRGDESDQIQHYTFSIRQISDDLFEINTLIQYDPTNPEFTITYMYKVCAKKVDGEFKLFNYLHFSKQKLQTRESEYINYYYPHSLNPKQSEFKKAEKFITEFIDMYDLHDVASVPKITYVFANDSDEGMAILGLTYAQLRSHYSFAAFTLYPKIVVCKIPDHIHELVHTNFMVKYPHAPMLLQEGIANYYGGALGVSFEEDNLKLKDFIRRNPDTDLSNFNALYIYIPEFHLNPFQSVGALLIREALVIGGTQKVLALFQYTSMGDVFEKEFDIPKSRIREFLEELAAK